jgi:hypothetical protein
MYRMICEKYKGFISYSYFTKQVRNSYFFIKNGHIAQKFMRLTFKDFFNSLRSVSTIN